MTTRVLTIIVIAGLAIVSWQIVAGGTPSDLGSLSHHYVERGVIENRGSNIVTSVVVNYRGLDTLGEVAVLFLSVSGVAFVLRRTRGEGGAPSSPASEIVQTGARLLVGPMLLFGIYIFAHGHLTPGGGFQGGAVVASAVLLLLLAERERPLPNALLAWLESTSGAGFVLVGLVGLIVVGSFLANRGVAGLGDWNRLMSAGVIPIVYTLTGLKVGSELATLLDVMMRGERKGGGR